jgi:hypothetical protein
LGREAAEQGGDLVLHNRYSAMLVPAPHMWPCQDSILGRTKYMGLHFQR